MIYLPMLKFDFMAAQFCRTRAELTRDAFWRVLTRSALTVVIYAFFRGGAVADNNKPLGAASLNLNDMGGEKLERLKNGGKTRPKKICHLLKDFSTATMSRCPHWQDCQMVCFQTKNPDLGKFWRALEWKVLLYFMSIRNILWPFGLMSGSLV
jgi:hypothetical protein